MDVDHIIVHTVSCLFLTLLFQAKQTRIEEVASSASSYMTFRFPTMRIRGGRNKHGGGQAPLLYPQSTETLDLSPVDGTGSSTSE